MSKSENPGGTPAGASQGANQQGNENLPTMGANGEKIAGKFANVDELAKGYLGLEQGFKELAAKYGEVTRVLEVLAKPVIEAQERGIPVGRGSGNFDPYGRGNQPQHDEDYIDPADFMTNPGKFLREREDRLANRLSSQIGTQVKDVVLNANTVNAFKAANPDLVPHEKIVQAFMRDQDPRQPLAQQLANAGKATRDYFASLKVNLNRDQRQNSPSGDDFVESPGGGVRHGFGNTNQQQAPQDDDEAGLIEYINDRNAQMAAHFGFSDENTKNK